MRAHAHDLVLTSPVPQTQSHSEGPGVRASTQGWGGRREAQFSLGTMWALHMYCYPPILQQKKGLLFGIYFLPLSVYPDWGHRVLQATAEVWVQIQSDLRDSGGWVGWGLSVSGLAWTHKVVLRPSYRSWEKPWKRAVGGGDQHTGPNHSASPTEVSDKSGRESSTEMMWIPNQPYFALYNALPCTLRTHISAPKFQGGKSLSFQFF